MTQPDNSAISDPSKWIGTRPLSRSLRWCTRRVTVGWISRIV